MISPPAAIMSFLNVLSCCYTTLKPSPCPFKTVMLNKLMVSALLDTYCTVTLVDGKLMRTISENGSYLARGPVFTLRGANGDEFKNDRCYNIKIPMLYCRAHFMNATFLAY